MNNNHDSKFSLGFMMGLVLGGGIVFLLGTKTGKNLLKIISEQGLDGLIGLLDEYNWDDLGEYEEVESEDGADLGEEHHDDGEHKESSGETKPPKKRFFKRIKR